MGELRSLCILALILFQVQAPFRRDVLDASADIPYFIADGSGVAGYDASDVELARMALEAWSRESGGRLRFVDSDSEDAALIRVIWVSPGTGLFGQTQRIYVDGRPGAVVFVTADVKQLGPDLAERTADDRLLRDAIVYLTCVHELGHAVGLPHTDDFADIMYSFGYGGDIVEYFVRFRRNLESRTDIASHSGLSDADRSVLDRLYREFARPLANLDLR